MNTNYLHHNKSVLVFSELLRRLLPSVAILIAGLLIITEGLQAQWANDPTQNLAVNIAAGDKQDLRVCSDGEGGAILVWVNNKTNSYSLCAQRLSYNGDLMWRKSGILIISGNNALEKPTIHLDGNKGAVVAWVDNNFSSPQIVAQRLDQNSVPCWSENLLIAPTQTRQDEPQITVLADSEVVVVWTDYRGSSEKSQIYAQRLNLGGRKKWGETGLPIFVSSENQTVPQVSGDNGGEVYIAWQQEQGIIFGALMDSGGDTVHTPAPVLAPVSGHSQSQPMILRSPLLTVWIERWETRSNPPYPITTRNLAIKSNSRSSFDSTTAQLSDTYSTGLVMGFSAAHKLITDNYAGAISAWANIQLQIPLQETSNIYAQRLKRIFTPIPILSYLKAVWNSGGVHINRNKRNGYNPDVVGDDLGGAVITWTEDLQTNSVVYAQRIKDDGTLFWDTTGVSLSIPSKIDEKKSVPVIVSDNEQGAIIAWIDERNGRKDIYAQRIRANGALVLGEKLTVEIPNGGDLWRAGIDREIRWKSDNFTGGYVRLEYSKDGGANWERIVVKTENNGSYIWHVPTINSTRCLLRVSDADDGIPFDESDTTFTIYEIKSVTVITPNGGEAWQLWSLQNISWATVGTVSQVKIELSRDNGANWETLIASTLNDGSENWLVSGANSDACLIKISDVDVSAIKDLSDATFRIISAIPDLSSAVLRSGNEQKDYQIISIPLLLASPSPAAVLTDDLGSYNKKKWRLFDYDTATQKAREFPGTGDFGLGKGFFLIVKEPGKKITSGSGNFFGAVRYEIPLYRGWNLVGNPYPFAIYKNQMSLKSDSSGKGLDSLLVYETHWTSSNNLEAWKGFAIHSNSADALIIDVLKPSQSNEGIHKPSNLAKIGWRVQITGQCQEAVDQLNYLGESKTAELGWDKQDAPEPPTIGEYVSVYFFHPEWKRVSNIYMSDVRPLSDLGQSWEFEVVTNIRDKVKLTFAGLEQVPQEFEIWLVDEALKISQNLRDTNNYSVAVASGNNPKRLKLVVGNQHFVEDQVSKAVIIPETYDLSQNFPNPFNPVTTIRYGLPRDERVTLKIYNLMGEEVATLVRNEQKKAGYHTAIWNGRNDADKMVSGVYFLQMRAGDFVQTRKMLLIE